MSQRILSVIAISNMMKERPSKILGIVNDYESYCFDEACIYINNKIQEENAPKPRFIDKMESRKSRKNNSDLIEWLQGNNAIGV